MIISRYGSNARSGYQTARLEKRSIASIRSVQSFRASNAAEQNIYYRYARKLFAHLRTECLVGPERAVVKPILQGSPGGRLLLWLPAETFGAVDLHGKYLGSLKGILVRDEHHAHQMVIPVMGHFQLYLDTLDNREIEAFSKANKLRLDFVYHKFLFAGLGVTSKKDRAYQGMYLMIELSQNQHVPPAHILESVSIEQAISLIQMDPKELMRMSSDKSREASALFEEFRKVQGLPEIFGVYDPIQQRWWLN